MINNTGVCPHCQHRPFNGIICVKCKYRVNAPPVMSVIAHRFQHELQERERRAARARLLLGS